MKKAWIVAILLALLLSGMGSAEEDALYPIREGGLWGYMNRQGDVVIQPQWAYAGLFRDGLAVVGVDWQEGGYSEECGLLRSDGTLLLTPPCMVIETRGGFRYSPWEEEQREYGKMGFYDKASGFLLPPAYDSIWDFYNSELLTAADWSEEMQTYVYGFIRRDTGEVAFPLQFTCLVDEVGCSEGYVLAADEIHLLEDTGDWGPAFHLYTAAGEEILFPEGIVPWSCVENGVLILEHQLTEEERAAHPSGWGQVFGLGRPDGTVVVEPMYDDIHFAGDGLFSISLDGLCGVMDAEGNVIVPPVYDLWSGGPPPAIIFWNGYAPIDDERTGRSLLIDRTGREVYAVPDSRIDPETGETRYWDATAPMKNGCFWLYSWTVNREGTYPRQENFAYALMRIVDGEAIALTEEIFDGKGGFIQDVSCEQPEEEFTEGLLPVRKDGRWGYIDENGREALLFQWDAAGNFDHGLAMVQKDGKLAYIDRDGAVVWQEP